MENSAYMFLVNMQLVQASIKKESGSRFVRSTNKTSHVSKVHLYNITGSHTNSKVECDWARIVLGWGPPRKSSYCTLGMICLAGNSNRVVTSLEVFDLLTPFSRPQILGIEAWKKTTTMIYTHTNIVCVCLRTYLGHWFMDVMLWAQRGNGLHLASQTVCICFLYVSIYHGPFIIYCCLN